MWLTSDRICRVLTHSSIGMGPNQPLSTGTHQAASQVCGHAAKWCCLTVVVTDSISGKGGVDLGSPHGSHLPRHTPDCPSVSCASRMQSGALHSYI